MKAQNIEREYTVITSPLLSSDIRKGCLSYMILWYSLYTGIVRAVAFILCLCYLFILPRITHPGFCPELCILLDTD